MPKSVLPQPALPQISVGRPLGKPPPVISSRPAIPDAHRVGRRAADRVAQCEPVREMKLTDHGKGLFDGTARRQRSVGLRGFHGTGLPCTSKII